MTNGKYVKVREDVELPDMLKGYKGKIGKIISVRLRDVQHPYTVQFNEENSVCFHGSEINVVDKPKA